MIRWERKHGLPVYRVPGGTNPRVFAYPDELDRWLETRGAAETLTEALTDTATHFTGPALIESASRYPYTANQRVRMLAAVGVMVLLVAAVAWAVGRNLPGPPRRVVVSGNHLIALDAHDRTRWSYRFRENGVGRPARIASHIGDLDGDRREDVVVTVEAGDPSTNQFAGKLLRFSDTGQLQWSVSVDDQIRFRERDYGPPWAPDQLVVYRAGEENRIAWIVHHFTWWPGLLLTFNTNGQRLGTFVNSGWLRNVAPSADGRHLLVTGISQNKQAYILATLEMGQPTAQSPEAPGDATECVSCEGSRSPVSYFVFPRTDVGRSQSFPGDGPSLVVFDDGTMQVQVIESHGPRLASIIYELSADLQLREARFSDAFWEQHRLLEQQGLIEHAAQDCPERRGLSVQRWTEQHRWQLQQVPVQ